MASRAGWRWEVGERDDASPTRVASRSISVERGDRRERRLSLRGAPTPRPPKGFLSVDVHLLTVLLCVHASQTILEASETRLETANFGIRLCAYPGSLGLSISDRAFKGRDEGV